MYQLVGLGVPHQWSAAAIDRESFGLPSNSAMPPLIEVRLLLPSRPIHTTGSIVGLHVDGCEPLKLVRQPAMRRTELALQAHYCLLSGPAVHAGSLVKATPMPNDHVRPERRCE